MAKKAKKAKKAKSAVKKTAKKTRKVAKKRHVTRAITTVCFLEADSKSDGSGRRKRVSARHQVKRLDRIFEGFALLENRSGRRNKFSSFGADL